MREERKRDDKMYKKRQRQSKTEKERGAENIKRKSRREGETEEQREAGDKQIVCVGLLEMFFPKSTLCQRNSTRQLQQITFRSLACKIFLWFYT